MIWDALKGETDNYDITQSSSPKIMWLYGERGSKLLRLPDNAELINTDALHSHKNKVIHFRAQKRDVKLQRASKYCLHSKDLSTCLSFELHSWNPSKIRFYVLSYWLLKYDTLSTQSFLSPKVIWYWALDACRQMCVSLSLTQHLVAIATDAF